MKTQILEAIGEAGLGQSAEIDAGLAANDRIKYYLTLLQTAVARADNPDQPADTLHRERLASRVDNRSLDDFVNQSRRENGHYKMPGCAEVLRQVANDLRLMGEPFLTANTSGAQAEFAQRLETMLAKLPDPGDDLIDRSAIDDLTRSSSGDSDSFHRLVMDLHQALNGMQAELAEEHLDGAAVYHIEDNDRPLISAFMAGLNRTAPLKFNHPGLGAIATRVKDQLVIQNDLGTTDAHVMVIHVEGLHVLITHTDIHPERMQFLREMLKRYEVSWNEGGSKKSNSLADALPFEMITGSFQARSSHELLDYLNFLGSRLVFLIDWNRARKELRGFLRGKDRIALLAWAAEEEIGQRAFLELGGAQLINRAIEDAAGSAMHFGERLCDVLGHEAATSFIRFVFRTAMEGLRDHHSPGFIQDRVRAELQARFSSEGKRLFQFASEQAAIIFEIASLLRDGIHNIESGDRHGRYNRLAQRAREFEHRADQLVVACRDAVRRRPEYAALFRLLETADNAADELEEVAFLMKLLVESEPTGEVLETLATLADLLVEAAQEWIKALSHASHMDKSAGMAAQDDVSDFLTAVDALFALEHRADDVERALIYAAVQKARDFRQLHIYSNMANSLEEASDALKWAGLIARDYLLGNVLGA
jgi:uncharacterized protein Yka (UPF0111/DUF47 family)